MWPGRQPGNVFVVFLVSALWHGANWSFVVWGGIHGALFLPGMLLRRNQAYLDAVAQGRFLPSAKEGCQMMATFAGVWFCLDLLPRREPVTGC